MRSISLFLIGLFALSACGEKPTETTALPVLTVADRLAAPADPANGKAIFRQCAVCHATEKDAKHRVGPTLWDVFEQPAGRHADFSYSRALQRSEIVWDANTLNAYIEQPQNVIPGGRMAYRGNNNEADRRDIVAYLETLSE